MASLYRFTPIVFAESMSTAIPRRSLLRFQLPVWNSLSRGAKTDAPIDVTSEQFEGIDIEILETSEKSLSEEQLRSLRDISRLKQHDRNRTHYKPPFDEPYAPAHFTERYHRRMFGRYGSESGVNPGVCWPTKEALADMKEYERVAYPYTILEVAEREAAKAAELERQKWERDEQIAANVVKMHTAMAALEQKTYIKLKEKEAAQARRSRLIAEVKEHFNYGVNERDERFKEEMKLRAEKLREQVKLARKAEKKEKMVQVKAKKVEAAIKTMKEKQGISDDKDAEEK